LNVWKSIYSTTGYTLTMQARVEEDGGLVERFQIDLMLHGDLDDA